MSDLQSLKTAEPPATAVRDQLPDIEERKRLLAHQIWEDEGRPEGRAEEHWSRACLVLMSFDPEVATEPGWLQRTEDGPQERKAEPVTVARPESRPESRTVQTDQPLESSEAVEIDYLRRKIAGRMAG